MSSVNNQSKWIYETANSISTEYHLQYEIMKNGHFKLRFFDSDGKSCILHFPSSPSCFRSRRNAISTIRKLLNETFGVKVDKSLFTLQLVRSLSSF
jgi:hypothetical protein